jgi:hypothetical protein
MVSMKVRYTTRCAYCREWMLPGSLATRVYGQAIWHPACARMYLTRRRTITA